MHTAARLTLREWFSSYYAPWFLLRRSPRTVTEYECTLKRWEQFTTNPPLHAITQEVLAGWRAAICALKGRPRCAASGVTGAQIAAPTANKHLAAVLAILSKAGPPGPRNRDALGHLKRVPWIQPLREREPAPRSIDLGELDAIYRAAAGAVHPIQMGTDPAAWWRALIIVGYTCALRRGAMLGVTWADVDFERRMLRVPAEVDKAGRERHKALTPEAVRHLLRIRRAEGRVWPWPHSIVTLSREWHYLQGVAQIARHYTLHDLKRTAGTQASNLASPWVVQRMLDHQQLSTSLRYIQVPPELRELAERLPLPASATG